MGDIIAMVTADLPVVHLDPAVEVHLLAVLQPADAWLGNPLGLAHEAGGAGPGTGLALRLLHDGRRHWKTGETGERRTTSRELNEIPEPRT